MAGRFVDICRMSRMQAVREDLIYDPDGYKARVKEMWRTKAPQYDFKNDFHPPLCEQLVSLADLVGKSLTVLDVATGTGTVAISTARALSPSGTVTAVDLSEAMLTQARPLCHFGRGLRMLYNTGIPSDRTDKTCIDVSDFPQLGPMDAGKFHETSVDLLRQPACLRLHVWGFSSCSSPCLYLGRCILQCVQARAMACQWGLSACLGQRVLNK